jgi:hypothetical protein
MKAVLILFIKRGRASLLIVDIYKTDNFIRFVNFIDIYKILNFYLLFTSKK